MKKTTKKTAKRTRSPRRLVLSRDTVTAMGPVATKTPEPTYTAACDGTLGICP